MKTSMRMALAGLVVVALMVVSSCEGCKPKRQVNIIIEPEGAGIVVKEPDRETYRKGDALKLFAEPAAGYSFLGWSDGLNSAENPIEFTVTDDIRIVAAFQTVPTPQPGTLTVSISPAAAIAAGAQWRLAGQTTWRASGASASGLAAGEQTVEFRDVSGWTTPPAQKTNIAADASVSATGAYVETAPPEPKNFAAASGPDSVVLTWEEPLLYTVAGYHVYRAAAAGKADAGERLTLDEPVRSLRYVDETGLPGQRYEYWVTSITKTGVESASSASQQAASGVVKMRLPKMAIEPGAVVRIPIAVENASGLSADTLELMLEFYDVTSLDVVDKAAMGAPIDILESDSLPVTTTAITDGTAPTAVSAAVGQVLLTAGMPDAPALIGEGRIYELAGRVSNAAQWGDMIEVRINAAGTRLEQGGQPLEADVSSVGMLVVSDACMRGDLDDSKLVAGEDADLSLDIAARLVAPTECHWKAGDLNLDAKINSADATIILRVLAGWYDDPQEDGIPSLRDLLRPAQPITVSLTGGSVDAGRDILVPVTLLVPGGIHGAEITVGWPVAGEQLTLVGVTPNPDLGSGAVSVNAETPGIAKIALSLPESEVLGDTLQTITFAWLQFRVSGTVTANYAPPLTLLGVLLYGPYGETADWYTSVIWEDGAITVTPASSGEGEEPIVMPVLSVTPSRRYVGANATTTTFEVNNAGEGDLNWSAQVVIGNDWLSLGGSGSGTNAGTITAACAVNMSSDERTGEILVTASGAENSPQIIQVIQSGVPDNVPVLSVLPAQHIVGVEAGTAVFTISNAGVGMLAWSASIVDGASWCSILSESSGENTGTLQTLQVAYQQNDAPSSRIGEIQMVAPGAVGSPTMVRIVQAGTIAEGESLPEGEGEGTESVYVWGTGDDWQEGILDQNTVVAEGPDTPISHEMHLHPLPEYSTEQWTEHEAVLYLNGFAANVPGELHFIEYPQAGGNQQAKVWHMVTNQYQVRLVTEANTKSVSKDSTPESAHLSMVVGSRDQIPSGFVSGGDLYYWKGFPGQTVDESGNAVDNEKSWFNLTNGDTRFIFTSEEKAGVYQSIYYPVGNLFDCPMECPANFAVIAVSAQTPPQWQQDLQNDPRTAGWLTPPVECPGAAPAGYHYEYQGHTVVVGKTSVSCTLPGVSDPVNPRDYNDEFTDVTLIHSTTQVSNFVCQSDVIVAHTWKMMPNP